MVLSSAYRKFMDITIETFSKSVSCTWIFSVFGALTIVKKQFFVQ